MCINKIRRENSVLACVKNKSSYLFDINIEPEVTLKKPLTFNEEYNNTIKLKYFCAVSLYK